MRILLAAPACTLVLALACTHAPSTRQPQRVDCRPFPEGEPAVCEVRENGAIHVAPQSLRKLPFSEDGLSAIFVNKGDLYFVSRQGTTAPALPFDNGPDDISEGLARTTKNGKIGFVNPQLETIVEPVWDFAFPFQQGVAVVCMGCSLTGRPGEEHRSVTGGKWGYIDRRGKVVVPVEHDAGKLPSVETAARQAAPQ